VIITKLQVAPVELVVSSQSSSSCRAESRRAKWSEIWALLRKEP